MSIIGWLILGLIAGFIASKIINKTGEGIILDIVLGIVGAVVGGFLFSLVGAAPVTGLNVYSLIVAVVGAIHGTTSGAGVGGDSGAGCPRVSPTRTSVRCVSSTVVST